MKTRTLSTVVGFLALTFFGFQNLSYVTSHERPKISNHIRLQHARELLGRALAKKVQVGHPQMTRYVTEFIAKKVKTSVRGVRKVQIHKIVDTIIQESNLRGFDPMFLLAEIQRESSFNAQARGDFGEIGLMQVKPTTAEWIAKKYSLKYLGRATLLDPVQNIRIGAAYLSYLRKRLPVHGAYISAYNMGPTNLRRMVAQNTPPTHYLNDVMANYESFYTEVFILHNSNRRIAKF